MKKFFEAAGALFPHMALVVCFASGAITFGVAPGLRVPLLFLSFSSLSLFWIFNLRFINKNILYLITFGILYLFLFLFFGLVRDQETTSDIFNIIFTGIAGGFFVNGVLWGGSKHFRSKNTNMLVLISAPILIAILAKSTAGYTSYMQLAISMVGGGRELSLDTGNPVGVAYANAISAICFLFLVNLQVE